MRRMSVSANTALRCTTCIHIANMLYNKCMLLTERRQFTTLWSSVMSIDCTLLCAVKSFGNRVRKYKRCSFPCGIEKYSTCPRNKVFAYRLTPYPLDECCIFQYRTQMNTVCMSYQRFTYISMLCSSSSLM